MNEASRVAATSVELSESNTDTFSKLKVLRVLRILRLIKLLRLLRMSRLAKRWEARVAVNYAALALMKTFFMLGFGSHLFACVWTLQSDIFHDARHDTWLGYYGLCWARGDATPAQLLSSDATTFHGHSICKNAGQVATHGALKPWALKPWAHKLWAHAIGSR